MPAGMGRLATQPKVNGSRCAARARSSWASSHVDPGMRASQGSGAKTGGKNRSRLSEGVSTTSQWWRR